MHGFKFYALLAMGLMMAANVYGSSSQVSAPSSTRDEPKDLHAQPLLHATPPKWKVAPPQRRTTATNRTATRTKPRVQARTATAAPGPAQSSLPRATHGRTQTPQRYFGGYGHHHHTYQCYWVYGYYQNEPRTVWVPDRIAYEYVRPRYGPRMMGGRLVNGLLEKGYYREIFVQGYYDTRYVTVPKGNYWSCGYY